MEWTVRARAMSDPQRDSEAAPETVYPEDLCARLLLDAPLQSVTYRPITTLPLLAGLRTDRAGPHRFQAHRSSPLFRQHKRSALFHAIPAETIQLATETAGTSEEIAASM